jgi:hypothetical protein
MLAHAIAPAPSSDWSIFESYVTKKNPDGTPSEGSIVVHFSITKDISTLTTGDLLTNIYNACNEADKTMYKLRQPKELYELLYPGLIVALKHGKRLFAWAEITSPYYYVDCSKWAHRWDYKILRMAKDTESEIHAGWMKTFHKNALTVPADVIKIQALNKLRISILEQRAVKSAAYTQMVEANEVFQMAEERLNSLERALELSEVM